MNRRRTLAMLALAAAAPQAFAITPPAGPKRVAIVRFLNEKWTDARRVRAQELFSEVFTESGIVEGRDVKLELIDGFPCDWPPRIRETLAPEKIAARADVRRAREIVANRPDVIMVGGDKIHLFQSVTREIPLVFYAMFREPVEVGLVADIRHPGGNITGAQFRLDDFIQKALEVLKELKPSAKRVGNLSTQEDLEPVEGMSTDAQNAGQVLRRAASPLGLECVDLIASEKAPFATVERKLRAARLDMCFFIHPYWQELQPFLDRSRILTSAYSATQVREGALVSVSPSWTENYRSACGIVAQILRGASPASIPIRMPSRYLIAINLKTAKAWGITVPPSVLVRADVVIDESGKELP